jgi:hypothetical protein
MPRLPQSARTRRRLFRGGLLGGAGLAIVLIAVLIPNHQPPNAKPTGNEGPAQLAVVNPHHKVSTADRRAINATLDRFMPAGVARKSMATAWALAGPELKSASTLADWQDGRSPIPYYPVLEKTFHTWRTIDVGPRYVIFNLLVHAQPSSQLGSYVFSGEMVKQRDRWLVNRIYTIAIMNPVTKKTHEIGPADFVAPPPSSQTPNGKSTNGIGIVPVLAILALILLIPLTFGVVALLRARRWKRMVRAGARTELPPLPSGYLADKTEPQQTAAPR